MTGWEKEKERRHSSIGYQKEVTTQGKEGRKEGKERKEREGEGQLGR